MTFFTESYFEEKRGFIFRSSVSQMDKTKLIIADYCLSMTQNSQFESWSQLTLDKELA